MTLPYVPIRLQTFHNSEIIGNNFNIQMPLFSWIVVQCHFKCTAYFVKKIAVNSWPPQMSVLKLLLYNTCTILFYILPNIVVIFCTIVFDDLCFTGQANPTVVRIGWYATPPLLMMTTLWLSSPWETTSASLQLPQHGMGMAHSTLLLSSLSRWVNFNILNTMIMNKNRMNIIII